MKRLDLVKTIVRVVTQWAWKRECRALALVREWAITDYVMGQTHSRRELHEAQAEHSRIYRAFHELHPDARSTARWSMEPDPDEQEEQQ